MDCNVGEVDGTFFFVSQLERHLLVTSDQSLAAERFLWITSHADVLLWPFSAFAPQYYQFGTRPPARDLESIKLAFEYFRDFDNLEESTETNSLEAAQNGLRFIKKLEDMTFAWEFSEKNTGYPEKTTLYKNGRVISEHRVVEWFEAGDFGIAFPSKVVLDEFKEGILTKRRNVEILEIKLNENIQLKVPFENSNSVLDLDIDETFNTDG